MKEAGGVLVHENGDPWCQVTQTADKNTLRIGADNLVK
jgi:hypothetical protein